MTVADGLRAAEARLAHGPHPERARRDAELLLLHLLERGRAWLIAHRDEELSAADAVRYHALVDRRAAGEPMQYITGEQEFYGLTFAVDARVLIPRPETELLVERALELAAGFPAPRVVDVGTGSGAIAVAFAAHCAGSVVTAIDISEAALAVAHANAARNHVEARIRFAKGDLLAGVSASSVDLVLSNPPYIPHADHDSLAVEVREHEPHLAMFADGDGLALYRRLIPQARVALVSGGWLLMEIGYGQAEAIRAELATAGFAEIEFVRDLQGIERVSVAKNSPSQPAIG